MSLKLRSRSFHLAIFSCTVKNTSRVRHMRRQGTSQPFTHAQWQQPSSSNRWSHTKPMSISPCYGAKSLGETVLRRGRDFLCSPFVFPSFDFSWSHICLFRRSRHLIPCPTPGTMAQFTQNRDHFLGSTLGSCFVHLQLQSVVCHGCYQPWS